MNIKEDITARIEAIQAVNDIKNLKFKYLNACDLKKPNDIVMLCPKVKPVILQIKELIEFAPTIRQRIKST